MKREPSVYFALCAAWLLLTGCPESTPPAAAPEAPAAPSPAEPWPPVPGLAYPNLYLFDLEGKPISLTRFKGRPMLLHLIDAAHADSVGLAGGEFSEPFREVAAPSGALAIDERLSAEGVDPAASDLVQIHVLLRSGEAEVDAAMAQEWAAHFELVDDENTRVVYGDARYLVPATSTGTPGLDLVDPTFRLVGRAPSEAASAVTELLGKAALLAQGIAVELPTPPPPTGDGAWPPVKDQPYANLHLQDLEGNPVRLRSLAGTPLLIQLVATESPGSVGYTGGESIAPFRGMAPTPGSTAIDTLLAGEGLPRADPRLLRVHILFFEGMSTHPTLELAKAWDEHFGLSEHANTKVYLADVRYMTRQTLPMVPGYHLVDRDFVFLSNGTRGHDHLYQHTLRTALRLATGKAPESKKPKKPRAMLAEDVYPGELPAGPHDAFLQLLADRNYDELDAKLEALVASRRPAGSWEDGLYATLSALGESEQPSLAAWARARPKSFFALISLGCCLNEIAWELRGDVWANKVTKQGWEGFRKHIAQARVVFERAATLRQDLPYAHHWLISVGICESVDKPTMLRSFKAAQRIDPLYLPSYRAALHYLQPRWHGSTQELLAFAKQASVDVPNEPAMSHVAYRALRYAVSEGVRQGEAKSSRLYVRERPELYAELKRLVVAVHEAYPQSRRTLKELTWLGLTPEGHDGELWLKGIRGLVEFEDPKSIRQLALAYRSGWYGLERDAKRSNALMIQAAQAGDPEASRQVGHLLLHASSQRPSAAKAARAWFERAVDLGDRDSYRELASMLTKGQGGPADPTKARALLQRAAELGDTKAAELLGR